VAEHRGSQQINSRPMKPSQARRSHKGSVPFNAAKLAGDSSPAVNTWQSLRRQRCHVSRGRFWKKIHCQNEFGWYLRGVLRHTPPRTLLYAVRVRGRAGSLDDHPTHFLAVESVSQPTLVTLTPLDGARLCQVFYRWLESPCKLAALNGTNPCGERRACDGSMGRIEFLLENAGARAHGTPPKFVGRSRSQCGGNIEGALTFEVTGPGDIVIVSRTPGGIRASCAVPGQTIGLYDASQSPI